MIKEACLPRTVLIGLIELRDILSENFLALFAAKNNLLILHNLVVFFFGVALRAVEPLFTAAGSDLHLSVQNMLAHFQILASSDENYLITLKIMI